MSIYKHYLNKYKFLFLAAVTCVSCEALCDLLQPTIMAHIIDIGVKSGQAAIVIKYGILMLMITALGACFAATRNILASNVSQNFGADLRFDVFKHIINFSEISADRIESGSLITRMTNDTSQVIQFVNGLMRIFLKAPIVCSGSIVLAILLSPRLSLILLTVVLIVTVFIGISMNLSYKRFALVQGAVDKVNTVVQEYLLGIKLVKAFGRGAEEENKFDVANTDLYSKSVSSQLVVAYFSPLLSLAVNLGIVSVLYIGSLFFSYGQIQVGRVAAFLSYMAQILTSLIMITNIFNTFVRTKASTERISAVLNSEEDFKGSEPLIKSNSAKIVFDHVTFAYPAGSGLPVIKNLSFRVCPGETLAVIGPTGSGKSTISWLCLHFYNADQGAIYLNGADVKNLNSGMLRDIIAVAPQKSMLFTGTVFENIAWGDPYASQDEVREAAQVAQADEFIQKMPEQYNSILSQGGVNLSGGQKQRLSIARALAKKSPFLILDDCTSALDAITEAKVRQGLKTFNPEKTTIMITQRIGTAMFADKILVLDKGSKVGYGSHQELLDSCPIYKGIYDSQIGSGLEADRYGCQ
jgi:ABC-type multidrug transport system, ATPase and permease components